MTTSIASQMYQRPAIVAARLMQAIVAGIARLIGEVLVWRIGRMMFHNEYAKAVALGKSMRQFLAHNSRLSLAHYLISARFDLHYGLALIYSGHVNEGMTLPRDVIASLEAGQEPAHMARSGDPRGSDKRRNYILGRAHNNLGYAYENKLVDHERGRKEYKAAVPYFTASNMWEEYANTSSLMGRMYTSVNERDRAQKRLNKAIEIRRELGPKYRYRLALSLNSKAIFHLAFGELTQSADLAREAKEMCQQLGNRRGIGLASITLGRALRQIAIQYSQLSQQERTRLLCEAERHLLEARTIFERFVDEPVRLAEINSELTHLWHASDVAPANELVTSCLC